MIAAALIGGLLAGGNIDRAVVQNAAWQHLGPIAWAAFSRHADLSPRGFALYPLLGIGGTLFSVTAAVSFRLTGDLPRAAALPIYAGALLTLSGLLATTQAASIMLSVPSLGDNAGALQHAFSGFAFWGGIRGVVQVAAFIANIGALTIAAVVPRNVACASF